jgi:hypothetical protein
MPLGPRDFIIIIIIIIIILLQLGINPVVVELTLIQTRKVYNIREQYKKKYNTENKVHTVQIQTYKVIKRQVLVFVSLHSNKDTSHYFINNLCRTWRGFFT